jgi:hypothetical protein
VHNFTTQALQHVYNTLHNCTKTTLLHNFTTLYTTKHIFKLLQIVEGEALDELIDPLISNDQATRLAEAID